MMLMLTVHEHNSQNLESCITINLMIQPG